jgi:hypothetical protein
MSGFSQFRIQPDPTTKHSAVRSIASRSTGDLGEFWHWSKAASEIALIEPRAEMDFAVLKALSDQEKAGRR